jgi:hypothetical protein
MGYFDALTSGAFKTNPDGRRLFFPYGVIGRGYVLPSEEHYQRLYRQTKAFMIAALVLIIGASVLKAYVPAVVITALLVGFYVLWTQLTVRGLAPSDDRLSLQESMTAQAVTHNVAMLWAMEIFSLLFVAIGVIMLVTSSENWLIGLASVAFFGLCAAAFARMLVLRKRQAP